MVKEAKGEESLQYSRKLRDYGREEGKGRAASEDEEKAG
jgi:hypothetical protein